MAEAHPTPKSQKFKDITNERFGELTVKSYAGKRNGILTWNCLCDCGAEVVVCGSNLKSNGKGTQRCWNCRNERTRIRETVHQKSHDPLHVLWNGLLQRCYNQNSQYFAEYGGRGIQVCNGWKSDFMAFYRDVYPRPEGKTAGGRASFWIDRIDNDSGYFCGHCEECLANGREKNWRWLSVFGQMRNKRNNRYLTLNGETKLLLEWASCLGVPVHVLRCRLKRKWSVERILTTRPRKSRRSLELISR